ncbi:magnesium and cobalt transport protein CorA [bacterium CG_4_9_14_3_um_filter_65_15]|nr:MAG: magnesium and cobalt transport protein CorA [bacterium CG_4_9_14_3_um_filter_65_15]
MNNRYMAPRNEPALPPGTLQFMGPPKSDEVVISVIDFDEDSLTEIQVSDVSECLPFKETPTTTWINISGLHNLDALKTIADHFDIHPLVQEDIVNTHQRPKVEDFETYMYVVARMLSFSENPFVIQSEQVSIILGPNFLITFQERPGDVFEEVRKRLRLGRGRIRGWGSDYLLYALTDAVVDHYFLILERLGELLEDIEEELLESPAPSQLHLVHSYKREMILMRKAIWPLREAVSRLERDETPLIQHRMVPFLRDVYDHTIQVADAVDTFRDMLSGLGDLYLSSVSNRMNEVMKVLTIAATIFVPLTFLAGIYGMNFDYLPELHWKWSYPIFWVISITLVGVMLTFFRRRKYL